jgi:small subunit ribosomal protein S9
MADEPDIPAPEGADAEPGVDDAPGATDAPGSQEPVAEAPEADVSEGADPAAEEPTAAEEPVASEESAPADEAAPAAEPTPAEPVASAPADEAKPQAQDSDEEEDEEAPRAKPSVPGAHLEVDIVPEGVDPLGRGEEEYVDTYATDEEDAGAEAESPEDEGDGAEDALSEPIATAAIDLAAGARYRATGKRKTAIARVTLRPGKGTYLVNGRTLEEHFPRATLQRNIRQPLETVGFQDRMDVVANLHGGGISAQAGALRHGVSRALLEADPNLRGELKRRGFLTRDSRAKERKKAGLKKARKRPQFSKR